VPLKDVSDMDVKYLIEGESLVIEHVLNIQVKKDDLEQQRKNISIQDVIPVTRYVV